MSLLNQVLRDLEKRNEQNIPKQYPLNSIKTTPAPQSKPYYLILAIIFVALIIIAITFSFKQQASVSVSEKIAPIIPPKPAVAIKKVTEAAQLKPVASPLATQKKASSTVKNKIENKAKTIQKPTKQIEAATPVKKSPVKASKPLSNKQLAENLFLSAQNNQSLSAKQLKLEQALKLNIKHLNARLQLANTLLQQGLTKQANKILKQGTLLFPKNLQLINLRSQLLLQQKQADSALILLQQLDANYIQDETYLGLLAATYQQKNNYFNSLEIYQKLVTINPDKAEYWLGLAIAYENLAEKKQALNAYQQALNKNSVKTVIVSYIKQRISILK